MIIDQAEQQSIEDRLMASIGIEDDQEEAPVDEEVETEEVEAEAEESDSEEETQEPVKLKLKRGDEEVEVDLEEAKDLAQQGYDYTKKTQELAEQRKQTEMYAQALKAQEQSIRMQAELQAAFIKDIAKVEAISEQLSAYEQVDWAALSDSDPVQAQKHWIQYQMLQNKRAQAQSEIQQKHSQLQQQRQQQDAVRLEQARVELLKAMPDFNADKAKAIRDTGKSYGFSDDELSGVNDPRMVKVLADAMAYRALQAEKANVTKKVTGKPPVVRPGAKDNNASQKTATKQMRDTLRKSGRHQDAAALIERMI